MAWLLMYYGSEAENLVSSRPHLDHYFSYFDINQAVKSQLRAEWIEIHCPYDHNTMGYLYLKKTHTHTQILSLRQQHYGIPLY